MQLISTVTVGAGGAASISFTSIPGTYTDLLLVLSLRSNRASNNDGVAINFNSDSGANYSYRQLRGDGSAVVSLSGTNGTYLLTGLADGSSAGASIFGNQQIYIPNYAGSTSKTVSSDAIMEDNATTSYSSILAGSWTGTAAITSIAITSSTSSSWVQYSTASLYGILKGSGGATVA